MSPPATSTGPSKQISTSPRSGGAMPDLMSMTLSARRRAPARVLGRAASPLDSRSQSLTQQAHLLGVTFQLQIERHRAFVYLAAK